MIGKQIILLCLFCCTLVVPCITTEMENAAKKAVYKDKPFIQKTSTRYFCNNSLKNEKLFKVVPDRNGVVTVLTPQGLFVPSNGNMFFEGTL